MPMKCIDQMPMPIASEPPVEPEHRIAAAAAGDPFGQAECSIGATTATRMDSATSDKSYSPFMSRNLAGPLGARHCSGRMGGRRKRAAAVQGGAARVIAAERARRLRVRMRPSG